VTFPSTCSELTRDELILALRASVKLHAHYAWLLNIADGGKRTVFRNADEWIATLVKTRDLHKAHEGTKP
jgi:hypothetical protein